MSGTVTDERTAHHIEFYRREMADNAHEMMVLIKEHKRIQAMADENIQKMLKCAQSMKRTNMELRQ